MKVMVTGNLPGQIVALLEREHDVEANLEDRPMERERLLQGVKDKEGLLCMATDRIDRGVLDRAENLKMIANYGAGYDNIDLRAAGEKRVLVSNTPGAVTDATADIAFALILAVARRVVEGDKRTRAGEYRFWAPRVFLGRQVTGKTLGIIGLGRIGKAVAKRARGFDMRVLYHNRQALGAGEEKDLALEYTDLDALLEASDFVSLHVPLTDKTRHLIGREALGKMKSSAFLINTSRGPVVDEGALVEALRAGRIAGAGLDVYEKEPALTPGLTELENLVLLPHVGSATLETRTKMARLAAKNLLAGLRGDKPPNCLNWEAVGEQGSGLRA